MIWILYHLFALFDSFVYGLASEMFRIIYDIANTDFFRPEQITDVANRIYVIVGVLMLFKLVIAAIQYMINPDTFDDKEKGMGGLLQKIAISLALIVAVPAIFNFLISIQGSVIKTLPSVILGSNATEKTDEESIGFDISFEVLQAFIKPRKSTASVGENGVIHDLISFNEHVTDGCPGTIIESVFTGTDNCEYDYMIVISTIAGVFLCYMLLTMILDIAIRTIKFGIIQMLAPIPISSYVFSKDKLNKFVKTTMTVYTDLFIRMAIVYFIIFAIQKIIIENNLLNVLNINGGGVANTGSWFRNVIVNVAIIFGLLMFASKAPKFLSELLGLPDVGSGDMADMFKPAWQRAGGAAGALINPGRNAVSNWRKAMENNGDWGNKHRRRINALRHAVGGFGKGALDAVEGVMAGDDWKKMTERHNKSVAASNRKGAAAFMRRTDKVSADERNEAVNKRRAQIEQFARDNGLDIRTMKRTAKSQAEAQYNSRVSGLQSNIATLREELATGVDSLGNAINVDEKRMKLDAATRELAELSTEKGKNQFVTDRVNEIVADDLYKKEVAAMSEKKGTIKEKIDKAREQYAKATTNEERASIQAEILGLMAEEKKIDDSLRDTDMLKNTLTEYVKGTLKVSKPDISYTSIASGKIDSFFGGEGFTGKGYIDAADLLKNNRSALFTGEAMTKLRQNANVLVMNDGKTPVVFSSKFITGDIKYSYQQMADYKHQVDTGLLKGEDLKNLGFADAAMFQSAFEDIEKSAADAYISANMAVIDPTVAANTKFRLRGGKSDLNSTVTNGIERLKAQLASSNIPKEMREALLKELSENPGKFFKAASTTQEEMRTQGSRISAYNSGTKDN